MGIAYAIGVSINFEEFLVVSPCGIFPGPHVHSQPDKLKEYFSKYYHVLPKGYGPDNPEFNKMGKELGRICPVIIKFEVSEIGDIYNGWVESLKLSTCDYQIIPRPFALLRMKRGFLYKFRHLDILIDIEQRVSNIADRQNIHHFKLMNRLIPGEVRPSRLKEVDAKMLKAIFSRRWEC